MQSQLSLRELLLMSSTPRFRGQHSIRKKDRIQHDRELHVLPQDDIATLISTMCVEKITAASYVFSICMVSLVCQRAFQKFCLLRVVCQQNDAILPIIALVVSQTSRRMQWVCDLWLTLFRYIWPWIWRKKSVKLKLSYQSAFVYTKTETLRG